MQQINERFKLFFLAAATLILILVLINILLTINNSLDRITGTTCVVSAFSS